MEVGVDLVCVGAPFADQLFLGIVPGKFVQHVVRRFVGGLVIGVGDVGDGYGLAAIFLSDPVRIRKVYADWGRWIGVAGDAGHVDHLGRDALHFRFSEPWVDRGVVLEPLGIGGEDLGSFRGLVVLDVDVAFPGSLASERVVVVFHEAVDEVHCAFKLADPGHVIFVPFAQVSGPVVVDKEGDAFALGVVLGDCGGFLEFVANLRDEV